MTAATIPECQHTGAVLVPSSFKRSSTTADGDAGEDPAKVTQSDVWLQSPSPCSVTRATRMKASAACRGTEQRSCRPALGLCAMQPSAGSRALLDALYHSSSGGPVTPQPAGPLCRGEVVRVWLRPRSCGYRHLSRPSAIRTRFPRVNSSGVLASALRPLQNAKDQLHVSQLGETLLLS